jgi:hypothetical protein
MSEELDEIQSHLDTERDNITLEHIQEPEESPLNEPVAVNQIGLTDGAQEKGAEDNDVHEKPAPKSTFDVPDLKAFDAPEQDIGQAPPVDSSQDNSDAANDFDLPDNIAEITADSYIGMANYALDIGGGFFVTVKKHADFYAFDELIEVIDEKNEKNVQRFKLDDGDQALLRPLLILVIKRRSKQVTPESQLALVAIAILVKKIKLAVEIRAENDLLVDKLRDIIREDKADKAKEAKTAEEKSAHQHQQPVTEPELTEPEAPFAMRQAEPSVTVHSNTDVESSQSAA